MVSLKLSPDILSLYLFSILSDTIPEMVKRMKTELAMESDLRLKKDQKQGGLIQKLLKEVKHLKGRNHILESQFRNFVQEEQVSYFFIIDHSDQKPEGPHSPGGRTKLINGFRCTKRNKENISKSR